MKTYPIIKILLVAVVSMLLVNKNALSQTVTTLAPGDHKSIVIGMQGNADYTRALILLHEMYNGTNLVNNYAIGTITARRGGQGAVNRISVAEINSSSAYQSTLAEMTSITDGVAWKLKSCTYNGKKYLALDVPYSAPRFESYKFSGWTLSSGENMKFVPYETDGQPVNQTLISAIADYTPTMQSTKFARLTNFMGNVGIGTTNPQAKLAVEGNIVAKEIKVTTNIAAPDYVFEPNYELLSLTEIERYIKEHKHLPEIPSAKEIREEGLDLAEMNLLLLKKVEELTLYLIEKEKIINHQQHFIDDMKSDLNILKKQFNKRNNEDF